MITFDWKKLHRATKGNSRRIITALWALSSGVPKHYHDPRYTYFKKDLAGASFLLNPKGLLEKRALYEPKEIAEYVALASLRNYAYYATTGDTSLDLFHAPNFNKNRLLSIENGRVRFKYEEVTKEK